MLKSEILMNRFSGIHFTFDPHFPNLTSALTFNTTVYLNPAMSEIHQVEVLAEEIGHVETSVGNITDYSNPKNWQQELRARKRGYEIAVPIDELGRALSNDIDNIDSLAGYFGVSPEYTIAAIQYYVDKYGQTVETDNYLIELDPALNATMLR
ncbi:ImmA/IrrE family metallo-endopeptidase [Furfurilactobacillus entadae]|uniref:ImmA/IrrE family metallo-endopeptidase n=1 Tax=Furfurilactobacillus entadae TaxID=2922307 RepID=UPI0035EF585A